ncbi:hypothetical protein [Caldimonas brevitalea]|uniref:hypothetical protein n=1 Tax=Caldimonas brevitalea TaxID=413882 RepID=UPI00146FF11C|nr:hypothetical protein [Caldimonas brevitalea]
MQRKSRWLRNALIASTAWAAFVVILTVAAFTQALPFRAELSRPCPLPINQLFPAVESKAQAFQPSLHLPVVVWVDERTDAPISMFLPGEQAKACVFLEQRARLLLERARFKAIEPQLRVQYGALAGLILVPSTTFFIVAFLLRRRESKSMVSTRTSPPKSAHRCT